MRRVALLGLALASVAACGGPPPGPARAAPTRAAEPACPTRVTAHDADPAHAAALVGKKVERVCVLGADETRADVERALGTAAGAPLEAGRVREDLAALMRLGTIEDARVFAEPRGDAVVVVYDVRERPRIAEVVFEGAKVFESEGLGQKVPLEKRRPFVPAEAQQLVNALRDEYARRGYKSAKIDMSAEPAGPGLVRLRFVVVEGQQWKIGKVTFPGASKVSEADLRSASALVEGEVYDPEKVERAGLLVVARYYDRGMLMVRVEVPEESADAEGNVTLTFAVSEGDVYRLGAVGFAKLGDKRDKELLALIKTRPKQVFDRSQITADVKTLEGYFGSRGRDVSVSPVTKLDAKKRSVDLSFEIEDATKP